MKFEKLDEFSYKIKMLLAQVVIKRFKSMDKKLNAKIAP